MVIPRHSSLHPKREPRTSIRGAHRQPHFESPPGTCEADAPNYPDRKATNLHGCDGR
jgi:hypothetical protein